MWNREIMVISTDESEDGEMPQQVYGSEFNKAERMVPMDMKHWVDKNRYRMLYDRKKQHYSAEAWITTTDDSIYDVTNQHAPGTSMEKGATQSLKEVEGITNALDSVPPHPSVKYETDGTPGEGGNTSV